MFQSFRPYQEKLIYNVSLALTRVRKLCAQLATGGGKTVIFSGISKRYIDANPGKSVLILVHRKKLLKQCRRSLYDTFGIDCQIIIAGMNHIPYSRVYVGMVESVSKRIDRIHNIGLVIIDEGHIANFNKIHKYFPEQYIICFTATPLSNNKKDPLKDHYEDIVCGVDIAELIKEKALCQNVTFAPKDVVDRAALEVSRATGDFAEGQMALTFSKPKYVRGVVEAYEDVRYNVKGTKTIIFNVGIDHSILVCNAFIAAGYDCKHIDSTMTDMEQLHILNWFHTTPNGILCNVGILTTGFDEPGIETVIVNRATLSMPLWLQMCGRGSRPTGSKEMFTIVDLGGNAVCHGDWNVARDWEDIFRNPPKPGESKDQPPVSKNCPSCDCIIPAASRTCKHCGYVYPATPQQEEKPITEMVVVTKGIDVKKLIEKNKDKKKYASFYEIGKRLAKSAKTSVPTMTDENAEFIYKKYIEKATEWAAEFNHKLSKWHYEEAKKTLHEELKKHFPTWGITSEVEVQKEVAKPVAAYTLTLDAPNFSHFDDYFSNMI